MKKVAVYNGKEYIFYISDGQNIISTNHADKADEGFTKSGYGYYYKAVSRDELTDIFEYKFIVIYDSGVMGVTREWTAEDHRLIIEKDNVTLTFYKNTDSVKGWKVADRYEFRKKVDYSELLASRMRLTYEKKIGLECNPPILQERDIKTYELYQTHQFYQNL